MIASAPQRITIFDLDGTLLDSAPGIAAALAATGLSRRMITVEAVRGLVSFGAKQLVQESMGLEDPEVPAALELFRRLYADAPCRIDHIYPGAARALQALREMGVLIGICTNKPQNLAEIVVERLGLSSTIQAVIGATPARPPKPDPAPLLETVRHLSPTGRTVFIGDSAVDAATAKAANVPFIFAGFGYGPFEGSCAGIIHSYGELLPLLSSTIWRED